MASSTRWHEQRPPWQLKLGKKRKLLRNCFFFSCCWRTVDRNYGDADIEPTSTGGSVRQLTGFVFGCLNKFKTTFVCVFFFGFDQFCCGLNTERISFECYKWALDECAKWFCVCVCVCLVQGVCGRESCARKSVNALPHESGHATPSWPLPKVSWFQTHIFFLSSSFVSHNLFRFWKEKKHS